MRINHPPRKRQQRGVALFIALVVLVGATVVSLASLSTGWFELIMAGNEESRTQAFHRAQAGLDAVTYEKSNFVVESGGVGYTKCTPGYEPGGDCDDETVTLPDSFDPAGTQMFVRRAAPLIGCPPRGMKTSCENYRVASFSVGSRYDETSQRKGLSEQEQGYILLVPRLERGRL